MTRPRSTSAAEPEDTMMRHRSMRLALVAALAMAFSAGTAHAYRFIQNTSPGRTSSGYLVTCSDPGGFTHWNNANISWYLNTANQGSGKQSAVQAAMQTWTNVNTPHTLSYAGTTTAGFVTDNRNTVLWSRGNGCNGSCLAITALVLAAGQVITETDISFNQRYSWNTNGSDYDVQAVCTHEMGHTLGMHHTEVTSGTHPTMYAYYFGTDGRTLESDDVNGIQCSANRYPLSVAQQVTQGTARPEDLTGARGGLGLTLKSRPSAGGAILRFGLVKDADVKVQVFDIAGRHVATLISGMQAAGEHVIAWDGSGDRGRVGSGMYFARVTGAGEQARATVILSD
jgi:hypothetical protein